MMKTGILFAALFAAVAACAQDAAPEGSGQSPAANAPWTLDDCIGFAQRNNIDVQRRTLQVEKSDVDLSTAKYSRLPDLNASVGADASFGRVLSSDNTYQTKNQTSGSLNVSASMPLFQGMRINHRIKAGKLDLAAAVQDMERAREDVAINVMTLYLEVLYNKEMVGVAERQLTLSEQQAGRSRALAAAGKQPESSVYESDALAAGSRMTLTQARNDLQLALLNLSQALNRESAAGFDIVAPALDSMDLAALHRLGSADEVYAYAAETVRTSGPNGCGSKVRSTRWRSPARRSTLRCRSRADTARGFTAPTRTSSGPRCATTAANTWGSRSTFRSSTAGPRATTSARRRSPCAASGWPSPRPNASCAN